MTTYYADTSVLIKWHIAESGRSWFEEVVESSTNIVTSALSIVEVYSAFNRLVREGNVSASEYRDLLVDVTDLFEGRYGIVPISATLIADACAILEQHSLRAYDAMHLASALSANQELISSGKAGLTFLSSDRRLLSAAAAAAEGLSTFDPATTG